MKDKIHVLSRAIATDQNHILLCKTLDLPEPFYYLPGGHVEHGEAAELSVVRELEEEAGVEATVTGFLGCLEHGFKPGKNSACHNHEYNLYFQVESPSLKVDIPVRQMEKHVGLLWHPLDQLGNLDFRPAPLLPLLEKWVNGESSPFYSHMKL